MCSKVTPDVSHDGNTWPRGGRAFSRWSRRARSSPVVQRKQKSHRHLRSQSTTTIIPTRITTVTSSTSCTGTGTTRMETAGTIIGACRRASPTPARCINIDRRTTRRLRMRGRSTELPLRRPTAHHRAPTAAVLAGSAFQSALSACSEQAKVRLVDAIRGEIEPAHVG
jgi:hypothetical protein